MPGRHHTEAQPGGSAPSPIGTLAIVALAVMAVIAGVATIAGRVAPTADGDDDPPDIVVQPSASLSGPPATLDGLTLDDLFASTAPSAVPSAPASPSGPGTPAASSAALVGPASRAAGSTVAPSPLARVSRTATASASPTTASPAPARNLPDQLTASYAVTSTSADGFVAGITVRNPTAAAQAWTVALTYPSGTRITVTGYWNATPTATGRRLRFEGGPLSAGASYSFGFQAATDKPGEVTPTGCTINGIPCAGY